MRHTHALTHSIVYAPLFAKLTGTCLRCITTEADDVPVPHFGCALTVDDFHALAERMKQQGVKFIIEPHLRFQGRKGEQWTMFFKDPSGNSLEFKAMTTPENLFAKYVEVQ